RTWEEIVRLGINREVQVCNAVRLGIGREVQVCK
ncbi:hypothetical protein EVA_16565, partial [gut metagenome]